MRRFARVVAGAAVLAAFAGAPARPARACGNEVEEQIDWRIPQVQRAERALRTREPLLAVHAVLRAFPAARGRPRDPLWGRAARVLAVAIVRVDGVLPARRGMPATEAQRLANLAWSVAYLRSVVAARRGEPSAVTDLAEALADRAADRGEARRLLEDLARRDVVTTAYGWAALARLRLADGDAAGHAAAVARCAALMPGAGGTVAGRMCALPTRLAVAAP